MHHARFSLSRATPPIVWPRQAIAVLGKASYRYETKSYKKRPPIAMINIGGRFSTCARQKDAGVDPEGIEPSSKRGNHTLSTRLSLPLFSSNAECRATLTPPYPLNFRRACEANRNYSRFVCTTMPASFGKRASE